MQANAKISAIIQRLRGCVPQRALSLFLCALILQGCLLAGLESVKTEPILTTSFVRPDDPQEEIGAREHPLVLAKYGGEYTNRDAQNMLAVIVGRLVSVSDDPGRIYKVTVLDTPKVNAFALPGGYLYLTRGLLALANDSSELAAVIAHEMAHVTANHAIIRQEKLTGNQVGEEVVNEVLGDTLAARVALAANQLQIADFSREQELQADAIGIRMIGRAGYDPYGSARFLRTMQAYQNFKQGSSAKLDENSFMSSHPTTPQRIELAKRHARFFGSPGVGEADRERYLRGINGLLYGDTADEGFVRGQSFSHSGLGITFSVPDEARIDNQPKAVIITGPGEAATRFDAAVIGRWQSLKDYLKSGWINGLLPETIGEGVSDNGLKFAYADALAEGWQFRIKIIQTGTQVYRFITAVPAGSEDPVEISEAITNSFRKLTETERASLAPLRLKIVTVSPTDNIGTMASRMKVGNSGLRVFNLINGLGPGATLEPGSKVKIVTDS
ncbi:MAG: M48 family metalloprotease [Pseudomonadota bacterium]